MSDQSNIEWCDASWQVTLGCEKVAAGCRSCYAIRDTHRMAGHPNPKISEPRKGLTHKVGNSIDWTGVVRTLPENLSIPLRWKKPRKIFVDSNSDLFHKDVPFEFIAAVYGVMAACPQHRFIVLTKRPERMLEFMQWADSAFLDPPYTYYMAAVKEYGIPLGNAARGVDISSIPHPLPNVIHGASIANQPDADRIIPILLQVPSACRAISAEPLVGPVYLQQNWLCASQKFHMALDIEGALRNRMYDGFTESGKPVPVAEVEAELRERKAAGEKLFPMATCEGFSPKTGCPGHEEPKLDWVIVGGESGPNARPCDVAWVRSVVQQCKSAGVPCFVKQLGKHWATQQPDWCTARRKDRKGADPDEWPEDIRVRQYPPALTGEYAPYPAAVTIECPECENTCTATKHFYEGDPFASLGHTCEHCGYEIMESEWNEVNHA